ncbi:MAG: 16S rRNA (uracil(1498)-N(3))-methyltransferase [Gammaproteobacteria bacterium]|nr:MAG: 16S rRNA (uracil(1498)-N(3))-methyltransferase [Gammaproteobacteria bacterium]RLA50366.1 MAG: 16S rRNA (uracil(1498)-N(3))-methyltransferase [Gammaproteobacteria bacterium]
MRLPRIFTDQALTEDLEVELGHQAARHLVSVLRFATGDKVILFNGEGGEYSAQLTVAGSKKVSALIGTFSSGIPPSPLSITLAIGLSRGDRMDWLVQKSIELGVRKITPLFTERSEVKLNAQRAAKKVRHWQEIARSACEQSGQNVIAEIDLPTNLNTTLQQAVKTRTTNDVVDDTAGNVADKAAGNATNNTSYGFILDPLADNSLAGRIAAHTGPFPKSVLLLSGPEGGFTTDEVAIAQDHGILSATIGPRILRTETAPIAALSLLQAQWGDWL